MFQARSKSCSRSVPRWSRWRFLVPMALAVVLELSVVALAEAEIDIDGLSARERFHLRSALSLAELRLERDSRCSALFRELKADGGELLRRASYSRAGAEEQEMWCGTGTVALFTTIRGDRIGICHDSLRKLDRFELAMVLIHEALHMAGVEESPAIEGAPSSVELNHLVREKCGF